MSSVMQRNEAFAQALKEKVRAIPSQLLHVAAEAAFLGSVRMTVQDSGEAAASWNISTASGQYITGQAANPVVGAKGEKRSMTGMEGLVISMMTQEFRSLMPNAGSLMDVEMVYITNSISGEHEANAGTIQAGAFSKIDAQIAVGQRLQELFRAF